MKLEIYSSTQENILWKPIHREKLINLQSSVGGRLQIIKNVFIMFQCLKFPGMIIVN